MLSLNEKYKVKLSFSYAELKFFKSKLLSNNQNWHNYLNNLLNLSLLTNDIYENISNNIYTDFDIEKLEDNNKKLYEDLLTYNENLSNPSFAVKIFGEEYGTVISTIQAELRSNILYAHIQNGYMLYINNTILLNLINEFKINIPTPTKIIDIYKSKYINNIDNYLTVVIGINYSPQFEIYKNIIENADLSSNKYLYLFGKYISKYEKASAEFFRTYSDEKIQKLALYIVNAYLKGFEYEQKNYRNKKTVKLNNIIGFEKLTKQLINIFREHELEPIIVSIDSINICEQYNYDHRFDNALYLTNDYNNEYLNYLANFFEENKLNFSYLSGIVVIEKFGKLPFSPQIKKECLKLSNEQQQIFQIQRSKTKELYNKYAPAQETSFNITAFPTYEIVENTNIKYADLFEDICKMNMLDNDKYEKIQQILIDTLDKAEYVHIKGSNNKTDLKIALTKLENPNKQTNFSNCIATVNVPVGEVFTSPKLHGTTGVLHISEIFLERFNYLNLELKFKDGFITDYNCTNFDNIEDNKKYILENLLFPHKTLPMGEFAIGTNTYAYVLAKKYNILKKLPILIIEKMGPHFAIGDTCYSNEEDYITYNPDNKEIKSKDNEKTLCRKTNITDAYSNIHIDITLDYESLAYITAYNWDGTQTDIIINGRFVLPGIEELNIPFNS